MAVLQADNIADIVTTTLKKLNRLKFANIATDLQRYIFFTRLMRGKNASKATSSGYGCQWQVLVGGDSQAAAVGLYQTVSVNQTDVFQTASFPWRHFWNAYTWDEREDSMNQGEEQIQRYIESKRIWALIDLADKLETQFWSAPSSSSNNTDMWGLPYWVVKSATQGFNGLAPTGWTSVGNLSATTYANWANYTDQYTNRSKDDLVYRMRRAAIATNFESPVDFTDIVSGPSYEIYTNLDTKLDLERLAEQQNDQNGNDLASKDGKTMFRGIPITYVPKLDADTNEPVYGIAWGSLFIDFLMNQYLKEMPPENVPNQPAVKRRNIMLSCNVGCYDRRRNWVIREA